MTQRRNEAIASVLWKKKKQNKKLKSMDDTKKRDGVNDYRKCLKHRAWKTKGKCELCLLEETARQKEIEKQIGSNKPEVKIGVL